MDGPLDLRLNQKEEAVRRTITILAKMNWQECCMKIRMNRIVKSCQSHHREIRRGHAIDTTTKLREIIEKTLDFLPEKEKKDTIKKTCQRTFQALRIDVNHEFEVLYEFMEKLPDALKPGGRVAILTFHSGEDRLVKKALKEGYKAGIYSEYSKDVIRPSAKECAQNGRARSTKMRYARKGDL